MAQSQVKRKADDDLSCVSLRSDRSKHAIIDFKRDSENPGPSTALGSDPALSSVSVSSDQSKEWGIEFQRDLHKPGPSASLDSDPGLSTTSARSDSSKEWGIEFKREELCPDHPTEDPHTQLDPIFKLLEEEILTFIKKELNKFKMVLASENSECLDMEENEEQCNKEAFLQITLNVMRRMKQEQLAERLHSKSVTGLNKGKLKKQLQQKFSHVSEGIAQGSPTFLNQIYTELIISKGEFNQKHETSHIELISKIPAASETITCEDLFKDPVCTLQQEDLTEGAIRAEQTKAQIPNRSRSKRFVDHLKLKPRLQPQQTNRPNRTVVTKGVAGIGKTVLTRKFSLDWAEGRTNQNIQFLFPLTFRELNVLRDRHFSLVGLLRHFFGESAGSCKFEQVLFIFDGLDECRLPLDFSQTRVLTDPTECVSVDVLLVNLIRGSLLPSARIWITTRPAAANQIPAECFSIVTEVRGFDDLQKEQYFKKRFEDEQQAAAIISHIKKSHVLYSLSYIPIFSWILSTVLKHVIETGTKDLPQTLTQMYIHFLVVQAKVKGVKYDERSETDFHWTPETREMVLSLGKLAFEQLLRGNLIFYESDMSECGLDAAAASVYSGVFTQVFREEPGLYQIKLYCFIHLSVQEFLAALYVHMTFFNSGLNLLSSQQTIVIPCTDFVVDHQAWYEFMFYRSAVDQAFESPNGHLDMFLRFLLGLSLPINQRLLRGLLTPTKNSSLQENLYWNTTHYLKQKLDETFSPEKSLNLLHCLNELNDHSLVEQIQKKLAEGRLSEGADHADWSALAFILLSQDSDLQEFDLRKYQASEYAFLRLLSAIKASNKVILSSCNLSLDSCSSLCSVLSSSCLTDLDLCNNRLGDSGMGLLCSGLKRPACSLQTLSVSGCSLSMDCCYSLSSVLSSSSLTLLDLSNNDLEDSGVELLCPALRSAACRLKTLRLSGCLVSERGGAALASALSSTNSCLTELDLNYNNPGESAQLLMALRDNPLSKLDTVRLDHAGEQWMVPGLRKYFCEFSLDPNTVVGDLQLRENMRSITCERTGREQLCVHRQDRFRGHPMVLSSTGLTGRCYWEVEWYGEEVDIAMRIGQRQDCRFGDDDQSWALRINHAQYSFHHNNRQTRVSHSEYGGGRVGVFLDSEAGSLSFYKVSSGGLLHLHTFTSSFTEPLFPGFGHVPPGQFVSLVSFSDSGRQRSVPFFAERNFNCWYDSVLDLCRYISLDGKVTYSDHPSAWGIQGPPGFAQGRANNAFNIPFIIAPSSEPKPSFCKQ